jgi:hypothetical protein
MIAVIAGIVGIWFQFTDKFWPWLGGTFPLP